MYLLIIRQEVWMSIVCSDQKIKIMLIFKYKSQLLFVMKMQHWFCIVNNYYFTLDSLEKGLSENNIKTVFNFSYNESKIKSDL